MSLQGIGKSIYPRESAGNYIVEFVPTAAPDDTASNIIERIIESTKEWDSLTYIYVLDHDKRPIGIVAIEKLFAAQPADTMSRIMRSDIKTVAPHADQEEAVIKAITGKLDAVPVVDTKGKFIGAIDYDSILAILHYENVEDYMSDTVGTQTETIFIRSLSLEAIDVRKYVLREALVGLAMASVLSIMIFIFTMAYLQSIEVAAIVGLAMLASIFAAVFIAVLIPWALSKFQKDPAFGSGPFATIIQDILSIIIYFTVATLILFR